MRTCEACGHEHQGERLAYICIGCPCPEKPDEQHFGVGDVVLTVRPIQEPSGYESGARAHNQWGVTGEVTHVHHSHGLCYRVRHQDESAGVYEPTELESTN